MKVESPASKASRDWSSRLVASDAGAAGERAIRFIMASWPNRQRPAVSPAALAAGRIGWQRHQIDVV